MPSTENAITNTQPKMPFHFIPQRKSHLFKQIHFISQAFSGVDIQAARNEALGKFQKQTTQRLPGSEANPLIANFLNPQDPVHKSNGFEALKTEYKALQDLHPNDSITDYIQSVEQRIQKLNKNFAEFLKKEKEAFHDAYKPVCADEGKRKALWEMYAQNLQKNIQTPLTQFTKDIDNLVPQALIHYVNRLGTKDTSEDSDADLFKGNGKEKLKRKLHYKDSNGKPISITKSKETGEPTEIRIDPMSSLFGRSGNMGDAHAILAAYHGKDVPIKITIPTFEGDNIYTEMRDFIALLIFFVFFETYKYLEKKGYQKEAKQAALDKGFSLDNISLVDTRGQPIKFSAKDKEEVNKKLQELEREHLAAIKPLLQQLKKDGEEDDKGTQQHQQPSPSPILS